MHGIKPDYRKIGQTKMSHKQIEKACESEILDYLETSLIGGDSFADCLNVDKDIWINFNKQGYEFFTQNCQNFTAMLYQCIALDIPECERHLWEVMPEPASHTLAAASKVALVSQPYITASLEAAVGGVGVMEAGAAGAGATGAGGTGTTVATTGTTAVATTTATTEGGAVATTMGTTGTQAAGATTQTAAASTSHGAASVTATKGTGVGAGKAGVGAKFGGLGGKLAVVGHGAGATKAGLVAKGAIGLAMLHPVVGTATACGLLYVAARGRRDKKWKRKARREGEEGDDDSDSEPSVEDMLGAEQELLEMAENPTEEQDQRIAEYLAEGLEDLHLTQVTTEPAMMPEEMSQVEEIVPAGGVPRRTQTIV